MMGIGEIATLFSTALEKWFPDANVREKVAIEMATLAHVQVMGQIELNKQEAMSTNLFVAGWRPAIGWVCGAAYAYTFVVQPFLVFVLSVMGVAIPPLPHLDWAELGFVLFGMLGLGTMRSYDKRNGNGKA